MAFCWRLEEPEHLVPPHASPDRVYTHAVAPGMLSFGFSLACSVHAVPEQENTQPRYLG